MNLDNSYPKATSTVIAQGAAMAFDGSGNVTPATSSTKIIAGISLHPTAATDADYALGTSYQVDTPEESNLYLIDVGAGTATAANVGLAYDFSTSLTIDLTATSHKPMTVRKIVSATQVVVEFNGVTSYVNGV